MESLRSYKTAHKFKVRTFLNLAAWISLRNKVIALHDVILFVDKNKFIPMNQKKEVNEKMNQEPILPPWVIDINKCKIPVVLNIDLSKENNDLY